MARATKILEGLKILLRHEPDADADAQHDVLYVGGPKPEKLEADDRDELTTLGWSYDTSLESWYKYT